MRHFTALFLFFTLGLFFSFNAASVQAQCTDLFISEYVEGGGNNKCVEIFNPTAASIDLGAGDYDINRYSNGGTSAVSVALTGTIPAGGTYVICNTSATSTFTSLADQTSGSINWNGDDAFSLSKNDGADVLDIFGTIGEDPGSRWTVGGNTTQNKTLRRNPDITGGNTSNAAGFPSLGTEWTQFNQDTSDGLGAHTSDSCPPSVAGCDAIFISEYIEGGGNNKCVEIFNPTTASIDLGAGDYDINRYSNGGTSAVSVALTGTIPAGGTYVICNTSATSVFTSLADQTSGSINWNGDDAFSLSKNDGADVLDIFGTIGEDPGSRWTVGGNTTQNKTLRRNADVTGGNTSNAAGFPSLGTEWTQFNQDTYDGLGAHTSDCMAAPMGCSIDAITVINDEGTCDDNSTLDPADDTYTATIHVAFSNLPANGKLVVFGDVLTNIYFLTNNLSGNSIDVTGTFRANGQSITLKALILTEDGSDACQLNENNAGTALLPCSIIPDCSSPYFSEYIEGSSNNKCVEIYNPTASNIDLAAEGYYVQIFSNGATNPSSTIGLDGTLLAGGTYVLCNNNSASDFTLLADQLSGGLTFNGDDAVLLGNNYNALDIIGQIGYDPGSQWYSNGVGTKNRTIRRMASVMAGDNFGGDAFVPDVEWEVYPQNTFLGLGSHGSDCGDISIPSGPWNALNVNCPEGNTSTYDEANDEWDITSNCPPDNFHTDIYAYLTQQACGDFEISVKVEDIIGKGKGGLMIRESIAPQSPYVWFAMYPNGHLIWEWRANNYQSTQFYNLPATGAKWLKILKDGTIFKAYVSYNGTAWFQVASHVQSMADCPLAGFAVETLNYFPTTFTISHLNLETGEQGLASSDDDNKETHIGKNGEVIPEFPVFNSSDVLSEVELYPNPAGEWLNISLPSTMKEAGTLQILDANGKVLMNQNFDEASSFINVNFNQINIPGGMYIVRLETANQAVNKQFIKR